MKLTFVLLFYSVILFFSGCTSNNLAGVWEYNVKRPSGDFKGFMVLEKSNNSGYNGFLIADDSDTMKLLNPKLINNHLSALFMIGTNNFQLTGNFNGDEFNGVIISLRDTSIMVASRIEDSLIETNIGQNNIENEFSPVSVIFDTDFGPDYDDVGAIAMLHAFADSNEIEILATIACTIHTNVAPALDAFNTYFNRPDIPIAIPSKNGVDIADPQFWTDSIISKYPHDLRRNDQSESATDLYRKILASQPDSSVVIITVGFLTNLANLLQSGPDKYSPLTGPELISKKVKELVSMAGRFPEGRSYNIFIDTESSIYTFENWPTRIVFSGGEIGAKINSGIPLINNKSITNSPVKDAYAISIPKDPQDKDGRMSWDQTAVLFAVKGPNHYFKLKEGRIIIEEDGSNAWDPSSSGHYHLVFDVLGAELKKVINDLMMHLPVEKEDYDTEKKSIPTIIYDGDIGPDPCDYTTIAILLNYHQKRMINLIGMVGTTPDNYLVPVFDIFNSLYGTNIPLGSYKNDPEDEIFNNNIRKEYNIAVERDCKQVNKNKLIFEKFGKPTTKLSKDVLSSVDFYRKTLSKAENRSVIIYIAGQLFNFPPLFDSKPDQYSSLSGLELVQKKVKQFVFMGGYFPKSPFNEWNWWSFGYANLTKKTIETLGEIKMPILYVGFEQGVKLKIGTQLGEGPHGISSSHPIVEGYRYFINSPNKPVRDEGKILYDNPAFDELPVFYLAEGVFEYLSCFSKVEGRAIINSEGANEWRNEKNTNEFYLVVNSGCEDQLKKLISDRVKGEFTDVMR